MWSEITQKPETLGWAVSPLLGNSCSLGWEVSRTVESPSNYSRHTAVNYLSNSRGAVMLGCFHYIETTHKICLNILFLMDVVYNGVSLDSKK